LAEWTAEEAKINVLAALAILICRGDHPETITQNLNLILDKLAIPLQ